MATAIQYSLVAGLIGVAVWGGATGGKSHEKICSTDFGTATLDTNPRGHHLKLSQSLGTEFQSYGVHTVPTIKSLGNQFCATGKTPFGEMVDEYKSTAFNRDRLYECTSSNGVTAVADEARNGTTLTISGKQKLPMDNFEIAQEAARAFCMKPA